MTLNEYQDLSIETAIYNRQWAVMYPAMGLAGEVGEVLNKVKKVYRDDNGHMTDEQRESISKELGDCLWYMSALANDLGMRLEDCALGNIDKLSSRMERGVIGGSGDDR